MESTLDIDGDQIAQDIDKLCDTALDQLDIVMTVLRWADHSTVVQYTDSEGRSSRTDLQVLWTWLLDLRYGASSGLTFTSLDEETN